MNVRHLLFLDANALWHRRLAEALGDRVKTTAFLPRAGWLPKLGKPHTQAPDKTRLVTATLPRGWASIAAQIVQPWIAARLLKHWSTPGTVAILASPAYHVLAKSLRGRLPYVYYGADDYRTYVGWGSGTAKAERDICRGAMLSVFVSEALRQRAVADYGLDERRTFVSPNATEPRFERVGKEIANPPEELLGRPGPILGILGALTDRLDIDLVRSVARLQQIGTFLVAGPVDPSVEAREEWLRTDPKVLLTGRIPHTEMHRYALAMDVALIPYARTPLNEYCSPMRLYDHLATGVAIFAADTCDQLRRCQSDTVVVAPASDLPSLIADRIGSVRGSPVPAGIYWSTRARDLIAAMNALANSQERKVAS